MNWDSRKIRGYVGVIARFFFNGIVEFSFFWMVVLLEGKRVVRFNCFSEVGNWNFYIKFFNFKVLVISLLFFKYFGD